MALAAAVVGPQLLCFVVQVAHGCPNVSRGSDRCECPNRPLASSRVCSADALRSRNILQRLRWAMLSPSPAVFQRPRPSGGLQGVVGSVWSRGNSYVCILRVRGGRSFETCA